MEKSTGRPSFISHFVFQTNRQKRQTTAIIIAKKKNKIKTEIE